MDNILSQLRKSTQKTNTQTKEKEEPVEIAEEESSTLNLSSANLSSSSVVTPFSIMKLDFDRLRNIKGDTNISEILKTQDYKIPEEAAMIVKKVEKFSDEICHIELVDETGTIGCSCMYKLVKENDIKIGNIIKIKGFSLWKIGTNHINLVQKNIIEIYN
ncbi:uncharacterized protein VNE69_02085 [Vairimorpha necatrix]|uniref:OB domain-containing protein n=1 Tax=Vairimorpha necatrix TaxID=6039 RepID=A0AAX4J9H7_9MICR